MHSVIEKFRSQVLGVCLAAVIAVSCAPDIQNDPRKFLVIVDMEPDDRIALMLLAAELPGEIKMLGTTGMHSGRKALLARQFLDQLGLADVPVIQGSGGAASSYPDISSSRAARAYTEEGQDILSEYELSELKSNSLNSSNDLSLALKEILLEQSDVEIVLLAPATDLVRVLEANPRLKSSIRKIHIMGGWVELDAASAETERRTSYNWNMDPEAASKLMKMHDIPMSLYSSHMIKESFSGGSVNKSNFPHIMEELENGRRQVTAIDVFFTAAEHWDRHVLQEIPTLEPVIGDHIGGQFTPADPSVVVGLADEEFLVHARPIEINIDLNDLDPTKGFRVTLVDQPESEIMLIEAVDPEIFRLQVLQALSKVNMLFGQLPVR